MAARYEIEGESLTIAEITARVGKFGKSTIAARIGWGWRTWAELKQPILKGRNSPWRTSPGAKTAKALEVFAAAHGPKS